MARVLNTFFSWMNLSVIETYDTNLVCDERLKTNVEGSTRLTYTGLFGELEHLKIEVKIRPTYDCRSDERLKTKVEDSTRLTYTGWGGRKNSTSSIGCHGHVGGTRPDQTRKTPKDLSAHESENKRQDLYECRCDERLKTKAEKSTRLTYTGLLGELEHLKIKTRLIDEKFASVMGKARAD